LTQLLTCSAFKDVSIDLSSGGNRDDEESGLQYRDIAKLKGSVTTTGRELATWRPT